VAKTYSLTASALVTVKVALSQPWSPKVGAEEVFRQAAEDAQNKIRFMIQESVKRGYSYGVSIVGEPKVTAVISEKDE
jgi:hypothetical protein